MCANKTEIKLKQDTRGLFLSNDFPLLLFIFFFTIIIWDIDFSFAIDFTST